MTPGQIVRRLLGPKAFKPIGRAWRAMFVDLQRVASSLPPLPDHAHILEVGGGDGQMMNAMLARYPTARGTMIDISGQLGDDLDPAVKPRVQVLPRTSIRDYVNAGGEMPDLVTVCDVVHHVPPEMRPQFFDDLALLLKPSTQLVIKDVRPGSLRALLNWMSDRYISGDTQVTPVGEAEIESLVRKSCPGLRGQHTSLIEKNAPNYAITFSPHG